MFSRRYKRPRLQQKSLDGVGGAQNVVVAAPVAPPPVAPPPVAEEPAAAAPEARGMWLDTDNMPQKQHLSCYRRDMSCFLKLAGNLKAWQQVAQSVQQQKIVFLHGPYGSGKTAGVHDLASSHLAMRVYEINPGNTQGLDAMTRDVRHITRTKTLLGPRLVLIDDIEGYDESYVKEVLKLVKEHREGDSSIVLTSSDMFDRRIAAFRTVDNLVRIRMYAPSAKNVLATFRGTSITNASSAVIDAIARETGGNFHQVLLRLKLHVSSPDTHVNLFKTTDLLLQGSACVDTWSRAAEPHVMTLLLHENAPNISESGVTSTALDRLADFLDLVSDVQCTPEATRIVGSAAQLFLHTTSVPVMHLSRSSVCSGRSERFRDYP